MSFKEGVRQFWLEAAEYTCQYDYYDEDDGWVQCIDEAKHVHHIIPEGWTLDRGGNPEENVALPLCERHHVKNLSDDEHTPGFAFHPDMGQAHQDYAEWKRQEQHINSINGRDSIDYSTSPFADAAREHHRKSQRDERYWAGSEEIDQYYIDKMLVLALKLEGETGKRKPHKTHCKTDKSKKRHWTDVYVNGKNGKS